jgi:hypothetical protein
VYLVQILMDSAAGAKVGKLTTTASERGGTAAGTQTHEDEDSAWYGEAVASCSQQQQQQKSRQASKQATKTATKY